MNVCKHHEGAVVVYSSNSCPFCGIWGILEAAEQKMTPAIGRVNTVRRALEKDIEKCFLSTPDVAGDFIGKARKEVDGVIRVLSRRVGNGSRMKKSKAIQGQSI